MKYQEESNSGDAGIISFISWRKVGMQSILFFIVIISLFFITFVFFSVGLAIYRSILVEVALTGVFYSIMSNIHITLPLAGIGGIFLAFMKQVIDFVKKKEWRNVMSIEKLEKKGDKRTE